VAASLLAVLARTSRAGGKPRTVVISPVDALLLKQAIALCHRDRHPPEREEICNRATAAPTVAQKAVRNESA
jgi:hypothetical protein